MIKTKHAPMAIAIATANGQTKPLASRAGGGYDSIPKILHGLDCGAVLAAVDACDDPVRPWLYAGYAVPGYRGETLNWMRSLFKLLDEYLAGRTNVRCSEDQLVAMAASVMRDHSDSVLGQQSKPPCWYAAEVGFNARNWDGRWLKVRNQLRDVLAGWEREGFAVVEDALHQKAVARRAEREREKGEAPGC